MSEGKRRKKAKRCFHHIWKPSGPSDWGGNDEAVGEGWKERMEKVKERMEKVENEGSCFPLGTN